MTSLTTRDYSNLGLCFLAGVLVAGSIPPFGFWPLGIIGFAVFCWGLSRGPATATFLRGFCFGLGLFLVSAFWLHEFTLPGSVIAILLFSSVFGAASRLLALIGCSGLFGAGDMTTRTVIVFAAAITLGEFIRGVFPFGGVPLCAADLGQVGGPLLFAAPLGGRLLIDFLAALLGGVLMLASATRCVRSSVAALIIVVAVAGLVGVGRLQLRGPVAGADQISVAIVQGGGERGTRALDTDSSVVFDRHVRTSQTIEDKVDLVLWPEDVVDVEELSSSDENQVLSGLAAELDAPLVAGVVEDDGEHFFRNFSVVYEPNGELGDRYEKVHRVPFGEFFPARSLLEKFSASVQPRDARPGRGPGELRVAGRHLAIAISFEVFFADRVSSGVKAGGGAILIPTNASSFRTAQVPDQEIAAARLRAVENNRYLAQAAPTGFSGFISNTGKVISKSDLGRSEVIYGQLVMMSGLTPMARYGSLPVVGLLLGIICLAVVAKLRSQKGNLFSQGLGSSV